MNRRFPNRIREIGAFFGSCNAAQLRTARATRSSSLFLSLAFAGAAASGAFSPDARALVIPDAYYQLAASAGPSSNTAFPTLGIGSVSGTYDTISGGVTIGTETSSATMNGPLVTISGSSTGASPTYLSNAMGIIQYYYAVIGPASVTVPMLISASVSTSVGGGDPGGTDTGATALVTYTTDTGTGVIKACSSLSAINVCFPYPTSEALVNQAFAVQSLTVEDIILRVDGGTNYSVNGSSFSATADPLVMIDPTWLIDHPEYSLVFSSNIAAPNDTVPEPQTYAMMLAGLGLLAVFARRRMG